MRSLRLLASLALVAASFAASANSYVAFCTGSSCVPFNQNNAYVQGLAVATAQANNAGVNDTIAITFEGQRSSSCESRTMIWTVAYAPVSQYPNLTFNYQVCAKG